MGSIREYINQMNKQASYNPQDGEVRGFQDVLAKLAFLKLAQEAAMEEAIAEEAPAEEVAMEEEVPVEEGIPEGGMDEQAVTEALSEIVDNIDELGDEDKEAILEAADALEDTEMAAGEKAASVMDYVALLNYLNLR